MRAILAIGLVLGLCGVAHAQNAKKGAAELLFKEGKRLMEEGNLEEACPKFAESQRLDPAIGTLLNLARCYEQAGRTASAWQAYLDAASLAKTKKDKRAGDAQKRATALEGKVPKLVVEVADAPADLVVQRDGEAIDPELFGVPVPTDPGAAEITATAEGFKPFATTAKITEGDTTTIEIVLVPDKKKIVAPIGEDDVDGDGDDDGDGDGDVKRPPRDKKKPPPDGGGGNPGRGRKILGVTLGVLGLGAIGTSVALTLSALSDYEGAFDDLDMHCDRDTLECDAVGLQITEDARSLANVATIIAGVGLAAVVTGTVLYLTAPDGGGRRERSSYVVPVIDGDSLGLAFGGRL